MRKWDFPFSPEIKNGCKIPLLHLSPEEWPWMFYPFCVCTPLFPSGEMWLVLLWPAGFPMVDFPWGARGGWKGKITPKLRSTTHPISFNSVVRFVWSRILVEKVRSFLNLIVLHMELHCYVNVCPKLLKRQSKHASMPVKGNHEITHPNSTSNYNWKPMET